jgi:lysozyme
MREQIKKHEGLRLKMYKDTKGIATIGYGFNLEANEIPLSMAEDLFNIQYTGHRLELIRNRPWILKLDPVRQGVLYDMAYNMGVPKLLAFNNTLKAIEEGRYVDAARNMEQSLWYKQVGTRAKTLVRQMETGEV